jgi:hypothetical protein
LAGELQRRIRNIPRPVERAGAAQRRGQHHLALGPVPRRAELGRSQLDRHLRVTDRDATITAAHRQLSGDPGLPYRQPRWRLRDKRVRPLQQYRRGDQPPDPQRVGGQPDQRIAGRLRIIPG